MSNHQHDLPCLLTAADWDRGLASLLGGCAAHPVLAKIIPMVGEPQSVNGCTGVDGGGKSIASWTIEAIDGTGNGLGWVPG